MLELRKEVKKLHDKLYRKIGIHMNHSQLGKRLNLCRNQNWNLGSSGFCITK